MEYGEQVRIDSTVVETNIDGPSDSSLLSDEIRILTRLMVNARKKLNVPGIEFTDRRKPAKSLARQIFYTRGGSEERAFVYRSFIAC